MLVCLLNVRFDFVSNLSHDLPPVYNMSYSAMGSMFWYFFL